ncbi:sensor histidine kinase [Streptomyces sp. BBFR2]|uniref:sensor histidine kinase n=1 Tax=Streptomyces sp. BBFR2 TaxID=3372854 RepID=UPI0037D9B2D2
MIRDRAPRWAACAGRVGLVASFALAAAVNAATVSGGRPLTWVTVSAALCAVVLLVPRLPWPLAPAVVTAVTAWWGWLTVLLLAMVMFDLTVARRVRAAVVCAVAVLGANLLGYPPTRIWVEQRYVSVLFALLLAGVVGLWLGSRRRLLAALAGQVDHLRTEAQLREEAARAAERSHIAAEMHDVLAHRLSLIALHTGVLATKGEALPAPFAERLALLRTTSTEALADLREVLGALRDPDATDTAAALAPAIRQAQELIEQARAAGQHVEATIGGRPEQAPTTHRLAVYRIVQEALTNARKHAGGAEVSVRIDYRPPTTVVEVVNGAGPPATGPDAGGSGYGLVGLRERVTALGGHLTTGPAGAGTWRLAALLPHSTGTEQNGNRT